MNDVVSCLSNIIVYRLPEDYYETYPKIDRALTTSDALEAAQTVIRPSKIVWVWRPNQD